MNLYNLTVKAMDGSEELLTADHCSKISMMDENMAEDIYILILQYFVSKNKDYKQDLINGKEIPFSGKFLTKDGKGVNFKVSQIPEDLQRIIVRYLRFVSDV